MKDAWPSFADAFALSAPLLTPVEALIGTWLTCA